MVDNVEPELRDDAAAWWRRLRQRPATATLMAICVLAYTATVAAAIASSSEPMQTALQSLWSLNGSEAVLVKLGGLDLTRVWIEQEWWRVLTTGLLHGSLVHLVLNLIALGSIGDWVEHIWGAWRTLIMFILSSIGGCLASLLWCEASMVVGASAGVLGQAGALLIVRRFGAPELQAKLEPVSGLSLALLILLCLFLGTVIPGIAQAGHLGGLCTGSALGWQLMRPRPLLKWVAIHLVLISALLVAARLGSAPTWRPQYHGMLGFRAVMEGDLATAEHHLGQDPENAVILNAIAYKLAEDGVELSLAESYVLRALSIDPINANYLDTLGWIWCREGKPTAGESFLRAAMFLARPPSAEIRDHVTVCASAARP